MGPALVVENDPTDDVRRLGGWLVDGGLDLVTVRPHAGEALPEQLDDYVALIVMGGEQDAYAGPDGTRDAPWFGALDTLLRRAVRHHVPTLAVCLGAQLLAAAHGGTVERSPSGPEIGPKLVARRDVAVRDPLFAEVPLAPDVVQWHRDEITELPLNAVLLAASTYYPHQAFRIGPAAWGVQFHIECDAAMFGGWVVDGLDQLLELGIDPEQLVADVTAALPDVEAVWAPFAHRFAAVALGRSGPAAPTELPLIVS